MIAEPRKYNSKHQWIRSLSFGLKRSFHVQTLFKILSPDQFLKRAF